MIPLFTLFITLAFGGNNAPDPLGTSISRIAEQYLEKRPRLSMEACNGLVLDILSDAGVEMKGRVDSLWRQSRDQKWTHHRKTPHAGDLVFWHRTYDRNRNGRVDDQFTHIGVVIRVDADQTVHMVHRGSRGIRSLRMNLHHQDAYRVNGEVFNDYIAANGYGKKTERLTGQLFAGFATVRHTAGSDPVISTVRVSKSPQPAPPPPAATLKPTPTTDDHWNDMPPRLARRILAGRGIYGRALRHLNCTQIWAIRNAIFGRHGYAFQTNFAQGYFQPLPWYERDPEVTKKTVAGYLSAMDYENLEVVVRVEKRKCHR